MKTNTQDVRNIKTYTLHIKESESQKHDTWFLWGYTYPWLKNDPPVKDHFRILEFYKDKGSAIAGMNVMQQNAIDAGESFWRYHADPKKQVFTVIGVDSFDTIEKRIDSVSSMEAVDFDLYVKLLRFETIPGFDELPDGLKNTVKRRSKTRSLFGI